MKKQRWSAKKARMVFGFDDNTITCPMCMSVRKASKAVCGECGHEDDENKVTFYPPESPSLYLQQCGRVKRVKVSQTPIISCDQTGQIDGWPDAPKIQKLTISDMIEKGILPRTWEKKALGSPFLSADSREWVAGWDERCGDSHD